MKIPGWWRVRHFYIRVNEHLAPLIKKTKDKYEVWKARGKKPTKGLNIIGFAKGDFGLAEHMRQATHAIVTTGIKFCVNNSGDSGNHSVSNNELDHYTTIDNPFLINLFCYNSNFTLHYLQCTFQGEIAIRKHYNIGYGYWELSKYPSPWNEQNKYLNEIWAPSRFIKEVIEKDSHLPVFYMPIPVDFKIPEGYTRKQFNLPEDSFLFLFTFDMSSFTSRKNPQAVIQAFIKAFPTDKQDKVCLVIKVNRIHTNEEHNAQVRDLLQQIAFDSRMIVLDQILDRTGILGLINVCDSYVSLHRAEGFGLGMAEAMKMGKVVIATNYSGNTDFMNQENSCPVNYKLIPVGKDEYSYVEEGAVWADPDVDHASAFMKKVYEDTAYAKKKGEAAKLYINTYHNFNAIGENYAKRLNEILYP